MVITENKTLWFEEIADAAKYRIRVVNSGESAVGAPYQEVSADDSADGLDEVAGEIEIGLFDIDAIKGKEGVFDFYLTAVDANGIESQTPYNVGGIEIDFLPPKSIARGGIR